MRAAFRKAALKKKERKPMLILWTELYLYFDGVNWKNSQKKIIIIIIK